MKSHPTVSVIVPTYNRPLLLMGVLRALAEQTYGAFEVIVVDQSDEPLAIVGQPLEDLDWTHSFDTKFRLELSHDA